MTSPRQVPPPEALLGPPPPWIACFADTFMLGLAGVGAFAAALSVPRWLPPALEPVRAGVLPLFAIGLVAGLVLVGRWARARSGFAELFHDRILLRPAVGWTIVVFLKDVLAFEDASSDFVRVTSHDEARGRLVLTIPTHDERGRGALLRALALAGVARDEGQPLAPTRPPGAVLLRIEGQGGHVERRMIYACVVALLVATLALQAIGQIWLVVVVGVALFGALVFVVEPWSHRRAHVVLREDRLELDPAGDPARPDWRAIGWDDVVGWSGAAPAFVHLLLRRGLAHQVFRVDPIVPTATPEVRAAVEALLVERGVPRLV